MEKLKRGSPLKNQFQSSNSTPFHICPDYISFISDKEEKWKVDLNKIETLIPFEITNAFLNARERSSLYGISRDKYMQILPFMYFHRNQFHLSKELRQYLIVAHGENYSTAILDEIAEIYLLSPQKLIQKAINKKNLTYLEKMRICNECTVHELNQLENQLPSSDPIFRHIKENLPKIYR
ncbi:hypothetical protein [Candidatus Lokiarchaeum ossiferum]|uniref:hypothetical protein n=1 Tax=Candidatus Lokiarchaeum ossiferum TaxID=2951803 RepID=UPI00352D2D1C